MTQIDTFTHTDTHTHTHAYRLTQTYTDLIKPYQTHAYALDSYVSLVIEVAHTQVIKQARATHI